MFILLYFIIIFIDIVIGTMDVVSNEGRREYIYQKINK